VGKCRTVRGRQNLAEMVGDTIITTTTLQLSPRYNQYDKTVLHKFTFNLKKQNWVCEESWKPNLAQSIFFLGSALGSVVLGWLGDHKGRLPVLVSASHKDCFLI